MRNQFKILLAVFVITISSCAGIEEKPDEEILLYYNHGGKFCEGLHRVYKKRNNVRKSRKGIWKFYHLNGKLEAIYEYDKFGDLKSNKTYDENGNLLKSGIILEKTRTYFEFYEDGNIKHERITKIETEQDEEEYETYYETIKEYFINGQLKSQKEYIDDELQGKASRWDVNGNLVIEYEYDDGLIKVTEDK
jgi:antitoxin component YwqK of YwqJK toxin-antitoxin module